MVWRNLHLLRTTALEGTMASPVWFKHLPLYTILVVRKMGAFKNMTNLEHMTSVEGEEIH